MQPIKVMLVDDNPADVELTKDALEHGEFRLSVVTACDRLQALEQLEDNLRQHEALPDLVLLDLNMPRMDGRSFLTQLRQNPELTALPVIVLTSSDAEQDIVKSYKLGANCYVNKSVGLEQFQRMVGTVEHFWLTVAKLP